LLGTEHPNSKYAPSKVTSGDSIVSVFDIACTNLLEAESVNSDTEIGDNQESDHKTGTSDSVQSEAAAAVTGWHGVI
jgi:hypothetical protein